MIDNTRKLKQLLDKLDVPNLDQNDLKALCLATISDLEGHTPQAAKVKVEAIRLLKDIVMVENNEKSAGLANDSILTLLHGAPQKKVFEGDN